MAEQLNVRIPKSTEEQIEDLQQWTGMTQTQIVIQAIDRLHLETKRRREQEQQSIIVMLDGQEVEAVSAKYAASYLGISIHELYELINEAKITGYKRGYGPGIYIPKQDLDKFKQTQSAKD